MADDDNLLDRPIVAGSRLTVGQLITLQDLIKTLPATENPWLDIVRDPGVIAYFLTQPAAQGSYLDTLRGTLRTFAFVLALRRLECGLDHLGRPTTYPALDRRLAREAIAAMNATKTATMVVAA